MVNQLTRHQVFVLRRGAGIYNDILPQLKDMRDKIKARMLNATAAEHLKSKTLIRELNVIIDGTFEKIQPSLLKDFDSLAEYEGQFALSLLDKATVSTVTIGSAVNVDSLLAAVNKTKILVDGKKPQTILEIIDTFSKRYKKDIKSEIELGLLSGDTTDDIVKRVMQLSNGRTRAQAKAVVLTIANHVGHASRDEAFKPYSNLFEGEDYTIVLDGRTSAKCIGIAESNPYKLGQAPRPPQHYRCRSIITNRIKPEYDLNIGETRASASGPVRSDITYEEWLRTQNKEVIEEVLGKTKAKLFIEKKVKIDRFIDDTGKFYTLDELKQKDLL